MSIPSVVYPDQYDTTTTLYNAVDALVITLAKDYNPNDTTIFVTVNPYIMSRFPETGIITLTENCSDPALRAVSFYYGTKNNEGFFFTDLTILPETPDSYKPKVSTTVSLSVTAQHHNNIKDAIISTEEFIGLESDISYIPFEGSIAARTKFLFESVFTPRAWFVADKRIGRAPLFAVVFTSSSLYLGEQINGNTVTYEWDFGDGGTFTSTNKTVEHTYMLPGIYTVSLTVTNMFGADTVTFANYIDALWLAPETAEIEFLVEAGQKDFDSGGNDFIKTPTGVYVYMGTSNEIDPLDPTRTYSGAHVESGDVIDPINNFQWDLGDTLSHGNDPNTKALYTIGGIYEVILRCTTESGAYRITTDSKTINVIERQNAWLFVTPTTDPPLATGTVYAGELGFLNETFKPLQNTAYVYIRNASFITDSSHLDKPRMLLEFERNTNINARSTVPSGLQGQAILSWASGRNLTDLPSTEKISFVAFSGFDEAYSAVSWEITRCWNWIAFNGTGVTYYLLGNAQSQPPNTSPVDLTLVSNNLLAGTYQTDLTFSAGSFAGASNTLSYNAAQYDGTGYNVYGAYSAYRYAFRGRTGYILKNLTVGSNFKINSFYSTTESGNGIITGFKKLPDMGGPVKTQGVLLNLTTGLFFFNNSGSVLQFDVTANVWKTGGPGYNSVAYTNLQDTSVPNYDDENNSLVGTTDFGDNAFLSFDYSNNAFMKFNDIDLTFTKLNSRPEGEQWIFGSY
jgi:PKD repeat protein